MASASQSASPRDIVGGPCATDVARGVARMFHGAGLTVLCEVPLPNGRRADLLAIDGKGEVTIVEIKVAQADLRGDAKWPDYLDYCDRFTGRSILRSIPHCSGKRRICPIAAG